MNEAVIGIDIGTSGVRIAAVGRNGGVIALSLAPIAAPLQNTGRVLQDPVIWWEALKQAFAALQLKDHQVLALAIDGTSGSILPIGPDGTPLGLASMYNDLAERNIVDKIAAVAPKETAALGGSSPLARAIIMQNETNPARILHQADWIAGRLCNRFDVTDENNALKTGYDPLRRAWPAWIAKTGMSLELLPEVVAAGTGIGNIDGSIAAELGLPADTKIVAGTTDGCAAFLASGAKDPGDGVTSLGTTLTLKLLSREPVFAPEYGIYSHRIGDQWLAGGASNTGGAVLAKYFSREDIARLTPLIDPAHPAGLKFYPLASAGERFPINDPAFEPKMSPRPADERIFFQAILEGIADVEALGYRRLSELGATLLETVRSVGGGAANGKWTEIRLKALGVPLIDASSEHAAVGTARLAWRGIGHEN